MLLSLVVSFCLLFLVVAPAMADKGKPRVRHEVGNAPVTAPTIPSKPLKNVALPKRSASKENFSPLSLGGFLPLAVTAAPVITNPIIDFKVLVIATDGTEADLPAITQSLDYLGTPYTVFKAAPLPTDPNANRLVSLLSGSATNSNHAYYQAVILTDGGLGYASGNAWVSALNASEWQSLWNFETSFNIRQVTWYTYPIADYGFNATVAGVDTTTTPLKGILTTTGKTIFSRVNAANPVTISSAWAYLAKPVVGDLTAIPLLVDGNGNALANLKIYPDGRQNLALTFDSNQYLTHSLQLSYDLISWVTKGLFLGERRAFASPQVDDLFIDADIWLPTTICGTPVEQTGATYRMTGADLRTVQTWQKTTQTKALTSGLRLAMVFNGVGTTASYDTPDNLADPNSLTATAKALQNNFFWINHTFNHENLDATTYALTKTELASNNTTAKTLPLTRYSTLNLVQPDVSGLQNPNAMQAAYDTGVRYVVSDTSKQVVPSAPPNTAVYVNTTKANQKILAIPRYPTNLFYNVSQPNEWVAEYNCLYRSFWGRNLTYSEILDKESDNLVRYLLNGDTNPWMFHETNLRKYNTGTLGTTLIGDLLDLTFTKYGKLVNLPLQSPTMDELGGRITDRIAYRDASVSVSYSPNAKTITITAKKAAKVPVTGLLTKKVSGVTIESYAGQNISYITLKAGQSITLPML